jgi:predicted transcriptional regulator
MGPIISGTPEKVWKEAGARSGTTRADFDHYFEDNDDKAHAIEMREVTEIVSRPSYHWLHDEIGFVAPNSWMWAPDKLLKLLGGPEQITR